MAIELATGTPFAQTWLSGFLRRYGCADLGELREAAAREPARFWGETAEALEIRWSQPYREVLDVSRGIMWPKWFVGGQWDFYDHLVGRRARELPEEDALLWEGDDGTVRSLSWREVDDEARRLASVLRGLGVEQGDRIGVFLPMLPETALVMLATVRLGAIAMPFFSGYGAEAVANRLNDGEAKVLVCADGFLRRGKAVPMLEEARAALERSPSVRHLLVVGRLDALRGAPPAGAHWQEHDYAALLAASPRHEEPAVFPAETPSMILYTSGTTGRPKGIVHTQIGFALKAAQDLAVAFDLEPRDRILWVTDMGWMMGPWLVYGGWMRGATIALFEGVPDHPDRRRLWSLVERHRLTHLGFAPTLARLLMAAGDDALPAPGMLETLRVFGSTGEPWNETPWRWLYETVGERCRPIINYSGGTEIGGGILSCFVGLPQKPCGFAGPIPGMVADVLDADGRSLLDRPGEVGELVLRAPWPGMTRGFWRDDERYLATYWSRFPNVWVHGDWVAVDADGHWFIQGRSDDTLKVAGKRVGPAEYESALVAHPWVAEAVAIGVPDPLKGEVAVCFVTLRPTAAPRPWVELERELIAHVAEVLGKALASKRIHRVSALPKTRNGKILRRLVRAAYLDQPLGDLSSLEDASAIEAIRSCRSAS
ncbi:MAG: AMP-binding protein [Tepidiphilus sp.]